MASGFVDASLISRAVQMIQARMECREPPIGLVLGSGWGGVADIFEEYHAIPYADIAGLDGPAIAGHEGVLRYGQLCGMPTMLFSGRKHFYQGNGWTPVFIPLAILHACKARAVVLTAATGSISEAMSTSELMIVSDHVNLIGANPLVGAQEVPGIETFPDQSRVYDPALRTIATEEACSIGLCARPGVLGGVSGPSYETPAETRMLGVLGIDAVGMSLVAEAMIARAYGHRLLGLCAITNAAGGSAKNCDDKHENLSHKEVLTVMQTLRPKLSALIARIWARMAGLEGKSSRFSES